MSPKQHKTARSSSESNTRTTVQITCPGRTSVVSRVAETCAFSFKLLLARWLFPSLVVPTPPKTGQELTAGSSGPIEGVWIFIGFGPHGPTEQLPPLQPRHSRRCGRCLGRNGACGAARSSDPTSPANECCLGTPSFWGSGIRSLGALSSEAPLSSRLNLKKPPTSSPFFSEYKYKKDSEGQQEDDDQSAKPTEKD